jgi:hypothetical protein
MQTQVSHYHLPNSDSDVPTSRRIYLEASGCAYLDGTFPDDSWKSCIRCKSHFDSCVSIRMLMRRYQIYGRNRTIAVLLCLLLLIEVCVGGYTISMTSPGSPHSGPPGTNPPCVAVPPALGWMIEFWVSWSCRSIFFSVTYRGFPVITRLL